MHAGQHLSISELGQKSEALTSVPTKAKLLRAFGGACVGVISQNDRIAEGCGSILI